MSNIPKLRFSEFSGQWEKKKLGDIGSIQKGNTLGKVDLRNEGTPCILYGELYTKYSEIIHHVFSKTDRKDNNLLKSKKNDVLIPASGETPIDISTASCILEDNVYLGGDLNVIRSENVDGRFLSYLLNHKQRISIARIAQGASVYHLYGSSLKKLIVPITSIPEQIKIANFLSKVDEFIATQEQTVSSLEQQKKGLMQKLFSQEVRFKDDNGKEYSEWEEVRLGALCNITTGKLDANAMVEDGQYRFYTCAAEYYKIDKYAFDTEALLISGNGANVGYVHYYKGKFNAYQRTYVLDNFNENIKYIKCYLDSHLRKRIENEKKAGNTPYIVLSTLTEMKINIPVFEEQKKIANCLSKMDKLIENEKQILDNWKLLKKGLLQQMFV